MWDSRIVLNSTPESKKGGSLLKLVAKLASAAEHAPCSCWERKPVAANRGPAIIGRRQHSQMSSLVVCYAVEVFEPDGQSAGTFQHPVYQNVVNYCNSWVEGEEGRYCSLIFTVTC